MAPVNVGLHWVLIVIDMEKKAVSVLDSLANTGTEEAFFKLWRYDISSGYYMKKKTIL